LDYSLIGEWRLQIVQYRCCRDQLEQMSNSGRELRKRLDPS